MNRSDELCAAYFNQWQRIKDLTQAMMKFCCPRTLLKEQGCDHEAGYPHCYCMYQTSHIDDAWKAAKEYGYDDDAAKEGRAAVDACPECSRYQALVDERKEARLALGRVKSSICRHGKRLEAGK